MVIVGITVWSADTLGYEMRNPVRTREIHGISPDPERPDFFTRVGEEYLLSCVEVRSVGPL